MNPVVFLALLGVFFVWLDLRKRFGKKKRKRTKKKSWFASKPVKTRAKSFYQQPPWIRIRDKRRKLNNEMYDLGSKGRRLYLKCDRCGVVGLYHQIDHVHPRKKFPRLALDLDNTQVLCGPRDNRCNQKKSDKTDGYNWRRIREWSGPLGPVIAWRLRVKQREEGRR